MLKVLGRRNTPHRSDYVGRYVFTRVRPPSAPGRDAHGDRLGVIEAIDVAARPIKQRNRGFSAGALLAAGGFVVLASDQPADGIVSMVGGSR